MARKEKTLTEDLIDITVAAPLAGVAAGVAAAHIPAPLGQATGSLIGVGLLKGAADIAKKDRRRLL